jgi:hypothetical protein
MIAYALGLILAVGIPFLLYCLWNFARELSSRTSTTVLSSSSQRHGTFSTLAMSRYKRQPHTVQLLHQGRTAS